MNVLRDLVLPLADSLCMDLTEERDKGGRWLAGEKSLHLKELISGRAINCTVKVMDSIVDTGNQVCGVVVRVSGNLYLCVFAEGRGYVTVLVLDGLALGFPEKIFEGKPLGVFHDFWSRKGLFERLLPGIKATFSRKIYSDVWVALGDGKESIVAYLQGRKEGRKSKDLIKEDMSP